MNASDLLDAASAKLDCNDADLARTLKVGRSLISGFRSGSVKLPDHQAAALAKLAGLDPAHVIAEIRATQAPPELAAIWREIARRAAVIASITAALGLGWQLSAPAYANGTQHNLYIMSSRRLLAWLRSKLNR